MQIKSSFYTEISNNKLVQEKHLRLINDSNADKIIFSGAGQLFNRYKINPDDVQVFSSAINPIDKELKEMLIKKLLEAHEHARKNVLTGNKTKSGYATTIQLMDGTWGDPATNYNETSISSICGERSSVLGIFNKALKKISLKKLENDPEYRNAFEKNFKAKYILMSSAKPIGTDLNAASPCADCLSWFNSDRLFQDESQIVFFDKDQNGKLCLKTRFLKEILPYKHEKNSIIIGSKKLRELDFEITPDAVASMKNKNMSKEKILKLIEKAQEARDSNKNANFTKLNFAATTLTNTNIIKTDVKFDWTKRWVVEPADSACRKAIKESPKNKIDAVAYYGNGISIDEKGVEHKDGVISLQTLGRLRIKYGNDSTLVISVVDNKIMVRTINDYMPSEFAYTHSYLKK